MGPHPLIRTVLIAEVGKSRVGGWSWQREEKEGPKSAKSCALF